jgi:uncharacterized repeat protein (TIGR02543 family)
MKLKLLSIIAVTLLAFAFISCDPSTGEITYTITFNAHGGTVSPASKTVTAGAQAGALPTPTKGTDTFSGWYTEADGGGTLFTSTTVVNANITVHAHWIPAGTTTYTITFNTNGGIPSPASRTVTAGETAGALPEPTRNYFDFAGWFTNNHILTNEFTAATAVNGDITIFAKWNVKDGVMFWGNLVSLNQFKSGQPAAINITMINTNQNMDLPDYNTASNQGFRAGTITSEGRSITYPPKTGERFILLPHSLGEPSRINIAIGSNIIGTALQYNVDVTIGENVFYLYEGAYIAEDGITFTIVY